MGSERGSGIFQIFLKGSERPDSHQIFPKRRGSYKDKKQKNMDPGWNRLGQVSPAPTATSPHLPLVR